MRAIFVFLLSCMIGVACFAQVINVKSASSKSKSIVDSAAIKDWPSLGETHAVSSTGKYFEYDINNYPVGGHTTVVRSIEGSWEMRLQNVSDGFFSAGGVRFIFSRNDTLFSLILGSKDVQVIGKVESFSNSASGRWLLYRMSGRETSLVVQDLLNDKVMKFDDVKEYSIGEAENTLALELEIPKDSLKICRLMLVSLESSIGTEVWSNEENISASIVRYTLADLNSTISFMVSRPYVDGNIISLWYYKPGMGRAMELAEKGLLSNGAYLRILKTALRVSEDGNFIFFRLGESREKGKLDSNASSLDVWNYRDSVLQSSQLYQQSTQSTDISYAAVVKVDGGPVIRLECRDEQVKASSDRSGFVVIGKANKVGDQFWRDKEDSNWLMSLSNGARYLLDTRGYSQFVFSPDGRFLLYFDIGQDGNYFSYDLQTHVVNKISLGICKECLIWKTGFEYSKNRKPINFTYAPAGMAGWILDDTSVLVYDNFDIWKLFLNGLHRPINMTNGFGVKSHTRIRVVDDLSSSFLSESTPKYRLSDSLLLVCYDVKSKYNGFCKMRLASGFKSFLLSMGPWTFWHKPWSINLNPLEINAGVKPIKVGDTHSWIVMRCSVIESPNYFITVDFKSYVRLTNFEPQKDYNWMTAELINWTQPNGIRTQGVLYKPENFTSLKKYPVIINYYQQLSHRLYEFPVPAFTDGGHLNIPWFVSRGYLIFTPDIYYSKNNELKSACNTVISAAKTLASLPYVDSRRIGIAGHSLGGAETNYIVTHTHLFAAVLSGAAGHHGVDLIASSLATDPDGDNHLGRFEKEDVGATIWKRADLWIENSPIFRADQVTSPLLIFYCKSDWFWPRAVEFFIALRRLGKRSWMLQYDNGGHEVWGKDAEDFTTRATQFFDYYLKCSLPPVWMTRGIPAEKKGIDRSIDLDRSGLIP